MSNNILQGITNSEGNINIDDFTKCYICLCKIQDASMCPNCQKISCQRCIQKWLMERKNQCPHCRMPLKLSQIINVRFINELSNILENISTKKQNKTELCKEHNINILYFCLNCNEALCSDCYMFGKKHKDHEINKLDQIYSNHVDLIKAETKVIQKKFDQMNNFLKSINDKIISVGSYKLEKNNELEELFDNLKNKLENKVHLKLSKLMQCKNDISEKVKYLENIKNNVEKELSESPKTILISKSDELIKNLKNLNFDSEQLESKFAENVNLNISLEIPSDVSPQYESSSFEINDYKQIISQFQIQNGISLPLTNEMAANSSSNTNNVNNLTRQSSQNLKEFIYSAELLTYGLVWRLKVYPFGNGAAKGEYISIFLELIEGLSESSKYFYKIELCNFFFLQGDKRYSNHSREFSSDFTNGECWGYNRFYKLDNLEREGFIDPEGKILIKFFVKPQTYSQLCRDQKNYISNIEKKLKLYVNQSSKEKISGSNQMNNLNNANNNISHNDANKTNVAEDNKIAIKKNLDSKPEVSSKNLPLINSSCDQNVRSSDEIAMNNFNMINNINNVFVNNEEIVNKEETNNNDFAATVEGAIVAPRGDLNFKNNQNISKNNINSPSHSRHNDNNEQENITNLNKRNENTKKNSLPMGTDKENENNEDLKNLIEEIQIDCNNLNNNKNELTETEQEVIITEINNKKNNNLISGDNYHQIEIENVNEFHLDKNIQDFKIINENKEKEIPFLNFKYHGEKHKNISHRVSNNKLDLYEEDLSFNNSSKSRDNLNNNNLGNNEMNYALPIPKKKNESISDDGSSFGSLMDSMKLIEESSYREKQFKNLKRIEKERGSVDEFVYSSNIINLDKNKKNYGYSNFIHNNNNYLVSNNSISNNPNQKNFKEKDSRSSSDKLNELMLNLYPENSFKLQSSNYKKYIQGNGHFSSSRTINENDGGILSENRNLFLKKKK